MAFCLYLQGRACSRVVEASGHAAAGTAQAAAKVCQAQADLSASYLKVIQTEHTNSIEAQKAYSEVILKCSAGLRIASLLREQGLMPFLQDPQARIQEDIKIIAQELGVGLPDAKKILLRMVGDRDIKNDRAVPNR